MLKKRMTTVVNCIIAIITYEFAVFLIAWWQHKTNAQFFLLSLCLAMLLAAVIFIGISHNRRLAAKQKATDN